MMADAYSGVWTEGGKREKGKRLKCRNLSSSIDSEGGREGKKGIIVLWHLAGE